MNRQQKSCIGFVVSSILFLILLSMLTGCVTEPLTAYQCPYPIEEVKTAEKYVRSVTDEPWIKIRKYGAVTPSGDIRLWKGLEGQGREDIITHERCHLYEFHLAGMEWSDTVKHQGWIEL